MNTTRETIRALADALQAARDDEIARLRAKLGMTEETCTPHSKREMMDAVSSACASAAEKPT